MNDYGTRRYIERLESDVKALTVENERLSNRIDELGKSKPPKFESRVSAVAVDYADGHGAFQRHEYANWFCPDCGWFVGEQYVPRKHNQQKANYCSRCGCKIDWSAVEKAGDNNGES